MCGLGPCQSDSVFLGGLSKTVQLCEGTKIQHHDATKFFISLSCAFIMYWSQEKNCNLSGTRLHSKALSKDLLHQPPINIETPCRSRCPISRASLRSTPHSFPLFVPHQEGTIPRRVQNPAGFKHSIFTVFPHKPNCVRLSA